jgi:dihydrofolate reductase
LVIAEETTMRKIVAGLFMSLDGVVESPDQWHFSSFNEEMGAVNGAQMAAADTVLLGRRTYEEFAGFWPNQSDDDPIAATLNNARKVVVSTTLEEATWKNSTLIRDDIAASIRRLKEEEGSQIGMTGSGTLVRWLLDEGLLDELHLFLHPIVVGSGKRLFPDGAERAPLQLARSQTFSTGVLYLVYVPAEG